MNTTLEKVENYGLTADRSQQVAVAQPVESPLKAISGAMTAQLIVLAISSVALAFLLIRFSAILESLGSWGYVGVAVAEFGNSAMLILPTPAPAYTFTMGSILNPLLVGVIGGTFAMLGELIGYALGRKGSAILPDRPMVLRLKAWTERWGAIVLFGFAALPVPFDVAGVWAGTTRYPLRRFMPVVLAGKIIKVSAIALAGYFGVELLSSLV